MGEKTRIILTDTEMEDIKTFGVQMSTKQRDMELSLISNYILNIIDFVSEKYQPLDVAITYQQIGDILSLNRMTIWNHVKRMRADGLIETYQMGLPKRQYYVNAYKTQVGEYSSGRVN